MNELTPFEETENQEKEVANPLMVLISDTEKLKELPIETVERLFELHERNDAKLAKIAFNKSMNLVQSQIGPVLKGKKNQHTGSMYARLEDISAVVDPVLLQHGFSRSMNTEPSNQPGFFTAVLILRHTGGQSESFKLEVPNDAAGTHGTKNKTMIQGQVSSLTYATRVLLGHATAVQIVDDLDGNNLNVAPEPVISTDQGFEINDLIAESKLDMEVFCKHFEIDKVEHLTKKQYVTAKQMLQRRKAKIAARF